MATDLQNLVAARSQAIADLAALDSQPNTSLDGRSVDKVTARRELMDRIKELNGLINAEQPWTRVSQVL